MQNSEVWSGGKDGGQIVMQGVPKQSQTLLPGAGSRGMGGASPRPAPDAEFSDSP